MSGQPLEFDAGDKFNGFLVQGIRMHLDAPGSFVPIIVIGNFTFFLVAPTVAVHALFQNIAFPFELHHRTVIINFKNRSVFTQPDELKATMPLIFLNITVGLPSGKFEGLPLCGLFIAGKIQILIEL